MKILLLGDFSACQLTLGKALADMGHTVTVASEGCRWMRTAASYSLRRPLPGKAGGALLYARLRWLSPLRGYDVVSLISPSFAQLRPHRLRAIFDALRRDNGAVFLYAAGTDKAMMDYYLSPACRLRYTEFRNPDGTPNTRTAANLAENMLWQQGEIADFCEYLYDHIDGVTTSLYEYHLPMVARLGEARVAYTGLPVELPPRPEVDIDPSRPLHFMLGRDRHRKAWKGTDRLETAARMAVDASRGRAVLSIVENVPYAEYLDLLGKADVLVDQLYSYTPAMNALLAMVRGKAVMSGGEEDFYDFIGERELRPVINVVPGDDASLAALFSRCIDDPADVRRRAAQGYDFVARHNDARLVARRHLDFWTKHM